MYITAFLNNKKSSYEAVVRDVIPHKVVVETLHGKDVGSSQRDER